MDKQQEHDIVIVTPVLNDWESFGQLVREIDALPELQSRQVSILAVDDGSTSVSLPDPAEFKGCIAGLSVLRLNANQGHQRAIALGLAHAHEQMKSNVVFVMDSDGEDRPEDIPQLLDEHEKNPDSIIVATRRQRSESLVFKAFYQVYKLIFIALTGKPISFGNFSLLPADRVSNVIYNTGIWNNYAATLLKCRVPIAFKATDRGKRYFGASSMNLTSLMVHGISAIAVFSDIVIGRIIFFLTASSLLLIAAIAGTVLLRLVGGYFVPGYATYVILFLTNLLAISLFTGFMMILLLLSRRDTAATLPSRRTDDLIGSVIRHVSA